MCFTPKMLGLIPLKCHIKTNVVKGSESYYSLCNTYSECIFFIPKNAPSLSWMILFLFNFKIVTCSNDVKLKASIVFNRFLFNSLKILTLKYHLSLKNKAVTYKTDSFFWYWNVSLGKERILFLFNFSWIRLTKRSNLYGVNFDILLSFKFLQKVLIIASKKMFK